MTYRRYEIEVPIGTDARYREAMEIEVKAGRLPKDFSLSEMVVQLFLRGIEDLRAEQREKARGSKLVITPDELAETQKRLRELKRGN